MRANLVLFGKSSERITSYSSILSRLDFEVNTVLRINDLYQMMLSRKIDAIIAFQKEPISTSTRVLAKIRSIEHDVPIIFMLDRLDEELVDSFSNQTNLFFLECGDKCIDQCVDIINSSIERKYKHKISTNMNGSSWSTLQEIVDWTWMLNADGKFVYSTLSQAFDIGFDLDKLKERKLLDLVPKIDMSRVEAALEEAKRTMESVRMDDLRILTGSGNVFHFIMKATPISMTDGNYSGMIGLCFNITDRVEATQKARKAEEWNAIILESIPDAVVVLEATGKIAMVNRRAVELFGFSTAEEVIGIDSFHLIPPEELERVQRDFASVLKGGSLGPNEYDVLKSDGTRFRTEVNSTVTLPDMTGRPEFMILVFRDVNERKMLGREMESNKARYNMIIENLPGFVWETDPDLLLTYVSPSCIQYGYVEEELLTRTLFEIMDDRDKARIAAELEDKLSTSGFKNLTFRIRDCQNREHEMILSGCPFYGEGNVHMGYRGVIREISKNDVVFNEFDDSLDIHHMTLENIGELVWTSDLMGKLTYMSPEFKRFFNLNVGMDIKETSSHIISKEDRTKLKDACDSLIPSKRTIDRLETGSRTIDVEMKRRDGSTIWVEHRLSIIRDKGGRSIGLIGICRDVTENKVSSMKALDSSKFLKHAFWNSPETIIVIDFTDRTLKIVECNNNACEKLGYTYDELIGMRINDIVMGLQIHELEALKKNMLDGKSLKLEGVHRRKDGTFYDVETALFLSELNGAQVVFALARDITDFKKDRASLQKRNNDLIDVNQIIQITTNNKDVEDVLERTMPLIKDIGGFDVCFFLMIEKGEIRMTRYDGFDGDMAREMFRSKPIYAKFIKDMMKIGCPMFTDNMGEKFTEAKFWGIESMLSMPFHFDDELSGGLFFASTLKKEVQLSDKDILVSIWKLISEAVELSKVRN